MSVSTSVKPDSVSTSPSGNLSTRQELVIIVALIAIPLAVFAQVHTFDFINYDDGSYVTECPQVRGGLTLSGIKWAFSREANVVTANWHPLTWLSLMSDVTLFGMNSAAFHLVNLALHIANVVLVFAVLRMLTQAPVRSAFVAVVFAIHPLHVESVVWVSERKDVLSTCFVLSSIATYLRFISTSRRYWLFCSLFCYILSLMSKQMFVTLPCLLVLLDYWPLKRISETGGWNPLSVIPHLPQKVLFFLVAVVFCLIALVGQHDGGAVGTIDEYPPGTRILNAAIVYVLYVWMTLVPRNLAVFYPYPEGSLLVPGLLCICLLIAVTIAVLRVRQRKPYMVVGWLWYLGTLVPVIGIVQIGAQRMADRYTYFPMVGLLIVFVWGLTEIASRFRFRQRTTLLSGCVVVAALAVCAHTQAGYWKSSFMLFSRAADVAKSSLAYTKLGFEQAQTGDFDSAATSLHRAIALDSEYTAAHRGLGNVHLSAGRIDRAVSCFRRTLRLDPYDAEAHYNLGIILVNAGQISQGIHHYEKAIEIAPANAEVAVNMGTAYMMMEDHLAAIEHLQRALDLKPDLPEAQYNLAVSLKSLGRIEESLRLFQKLHKSSPDAPGLREHLAELNQQRGDQENAAAHGGAATDRQSE